MGTSDGVRHPAKYSDALLPVLAELLTGYARVLDPFAGTGKLRQVRADAYLLEIEPEWASAAGAVLGNALDLPWPAGFFDAVCTSPTYGNRMADHHEARDTSRRNTYRHAIGHSLDPDNSGLLQWGPGYQDFHRRAWGEVRRVLRPGGRLVLNVSDHVRGGAVMLVTAWHIGALCELGFELEREIRVTTPRQRWGANGGLRCDHESVLVFGRA